MRLDELTLENALPLVGTRFEVSLPGGATADLRLTGGAPFEVRQPRGGEGKERRRPFALYFAGPREPILPQAAYSLRGGDVTFDSLFIVPIGRDEAATEYEAIFT